MRERLRTLLRGALLAALGLVGVASLHAATLEARTLAALRSAAPDGSPPPALAELASVSGDARLPRAVARAHLVRAGLSGDPDGALRRGARAAYALAVQRDPLDAAAWRELGWLHFGADDLAAAERSFETAVALAPASADGLYALGRLRERTGAPCEALALYRRSLHLRASASAAARLRELEARGPACRS